MPSRGDTWEGQGASPSPSPVTPAHGLPQLERSIKTILRSKLEQVQQQMAQNQTVPMLELGTSLLNQTTAQTRKLTDMEAQVTQGD